MGQKKIKKYTKRFVIYLTGEELLLIQKAAEQASIPPTVYARNLILARVNPLLNHEEK